MVKSDSTKLGIKSCAQRNRLREAGSVDGRVPVQAFFVEDHRNSEPAVLHERTSGWHW